MYIIYEFFTWIFFILASPFFLFKFFTTEKYRAGLKERLGIYKEKLPEKGEAKRIWIHAVSVGETMAASFLAGEISKKVENAEIFFSTTTATGQKTAQKQIKTAKSIFYFPLDFSFSVKRAIGRVNPDICILIETEIWPNFLRICRESNIPVMTSNGRISDKSFRGYRKLGPIIRRILSDITLFSMQTSSDAERIKKLGAPEEKVKTSGNMKFDQALASSSTIDSDEVRRKFRIPEDKFVIVFASTHDGEEEILLDVFRNLQKDVTGLFLVIAPRHPERFNEAAELIEKEKIQYARRTTLDKNTDSDYNVLLLDSVGELYMIFSICHIAFMGGSLVPVGGHNPLEASVFNKPVLFGPHMHNFRDIASIILENNAGFQMSEKNEILKKMSELISDKSYLEKINKNCKKVFEENSGATEKNIALMRNLIK